MKERCSPMEVILLVFDTRKDLDQSLLSASLKGMFVFGGSNRKVYMKACMFTITSKASRAKFGGLW